jgi:hypothetical protein
LATGACAEGTVLHIHVVASGGVLNVYANKIRFLVENGYLLTPYDDRHPELPPHGGIACDDIQLSVAKGDPVNV